jgi:DNA helicase-4
VLKNPSQIEKQVIPAGVIDAAAIRVAYYGQGQEEAALQAELERIRTGAFGGHHQAATSVLLLGRYHHVRPKNLSELTADYPELSIRFMTVHASKGLEADEAQPAFGQIRPGRGRLVRSTRRQKPGRPWRVLAT